MGAEAAELGITHFDLANNYGPPHGSAEETFGQILRKDLAEQPIDARAAGDQALRAAGLEA